jgi:hypothetical protein
LPFLSPNNIEKTKTSTMKKILLLLTVVALFTLSASAQRGHDGIRKQRIEQGFKSGQLTRGEKMKLHQNKFQYNRAKHRAMRDGKVNFRERRQLHGMRKQDRRETFRYKHNGRKRVI